MPTRSKYKRSLYSEAEPYYKSYIRKLIRLGHSPVLVFVGTTRNGKSMGAFGVGKFVQHLLNPKAEYTPDLNFHFGVKNYMKGFKSAKKQVHVDDEAGEELGGNKYHDDFNQAIASILNTQAYRQNGIILCLPVLRRLWEGHREHVNIVFHVVAKQRANTYAVQVKHHEITKQKYIDLKLMDHMVKLPQLTKEEVEGIKSMEQVAKEDIFNKHYDKIMNDDNEYDIDEMF